jgi:hypothetical protein
MRSLVGACALLLCFLGSARADWSPRVEARGTELRVNDLIVLRARRSLSGLKPPERAALAAERLRTLTESGLDPSQVRVDIETETRSRTETRTVTKTVTRKRGKRRRKVEIEVEERYKVNYQVETSARLVARGTVIAIASTDEAQAADVAKPSGLAGKWAEALRKALRIPGLAVSTDGLLVPWQERREVAFRGAAHGPITVERTSGPGSPITAEADLASGRVIVTGHTIGREVLVLRREGAVVRLNVAVQPYAGTFAAPQPVQVTGRGVDGDRIARLVLASARQSAAPLAGAQVRIESEPGQVAPPTPGKSLNVPITATITGPEMLPVRKTLTIPVQSRSLPPVETEALFFSNNPERILMFQTLYVGRLSMGTARLLYHHLNDSRETVWFVAELINDGDTPAQVQVVGGDAGPERDTVWVGYRVASAFVTAVTADSGMVVEVPARSRVALQARGLPQGLTLSGLMQLRLLSGPAPLVRIAADHPGDATTMGEILRPRALTEAMGALVADADRLSRHVYPQPSKKLTARYQVGGNWAFLSVGRAPIAAAGEGQVLAGNYGVFYDISVAVENPTDRTAKVQVLFEPAGGLAGAVFVIDGKRVEIPQATPPIEKPLATFTLGPGVKKTILMRTLPLSGSNYPINLIVRDLAGPGLAENREIIGGQ